MVNERTVSSEGISDLLVLSQPVYLLPEDRQSRVFVQYIVEAIFKSGNKTQRTDGWKTFDSKFLKERQDIIIVIAN